MPTSCIFCARRGSEWHGQCIYRGLKQRDSRKREQLQTHQKTANATLQPRQGGQAVMRQPPSGHPSRFFSTPGSRCPPNSRPAEVGAPGHEAWRPASTDPSVWFLRVTLPHKGFLRCKRPLDLGMPPNGFSASARGPPKEPNRIPEGGIARREKYSSPLLQTPYGAPESRVPQIFPPSRSPLSWTPPRNRRRRLHAAPRIHGGSPCVR
jgi:hypothetical protein